MVAMGLVLGACGGKSDSSAPNAADAGSGGSTADAGSGGDGNGASGGGGNATDSGSGGSGAEPATASDGAPREFEGATDPIDDGDQPDQASAHFFWRSGIGNWFVDAPEPNPIHGDAESVEIVPPRAESTRAYRVQGTGHSRGLDLWAQLDHPMGNAFDLGSTYWGIVFWAKLEGASDRVLVGANPGVWYFDAPDEVPVVELSISSEWQQFIVPFDVWQGAETAVASFDFIVGEGGGDFDFWIDDVALVCSSECPASE